MALSLFRALFAPATPPIIQWLPERPDRGPDRNGTGLDNCKDFMLRMKRSHGVRTWIVPSVWKCGEARQWAIDDMREFLGFCRREGFKVIPELAHITKCGLSADPLRADQKHLCGAMTLRNNAGHVAEIESPPFTGGQGGVEIPVGEQRQFTLRGEPQALYQLVYSCNGKHSLRILPSDRPDARFVEKQNGKWAAGSTIRFADTRATAWAVIVWNRDDQPIKVALHECREVNPLANEIREQRNSDYDWLGDLVHDDAVLKPYEHPRYELPETVTSYRYHIDDFLSMFAEFHDLIVGVCVCGDEAHCIFQSIQEWQRFSNMQQMQGRFISELADGVYGKHGIPIFWWDDQGYSNDLGNFRGVYANNRADCSTRGMKYYLTCDPRALVPMVWAPLSDIHVEHIRHWTDKGYRVLLSLAGGHLDIARAQGEAYRKLTRAERKLVIGHGTYDETWDTAKICGSLYAEFRKGLVSG